MNISNFIETYKVSESLCDDLIKYYENNKYDEYGLLLNYKPRKSATLVK